MKGEPFRFIAGHDPVESLEDRFWSKVPQRPQVGCWEWLGAVAGSGYGVIQRGRRGEGIVRTHRLSFEMHNGPIPDGLIVMHSCNNKRCVNPAHLSLGDHSANNKAAWDDGLRPTPRNHIGDRARRVPFTAVQEMRRRYTAGGVTLLDLANEYGCTPSNVHKIVSFRTRKHQ